MAENPIKWRTEDLTRLKKAVNDFNKKIRRLEKEENLLYLPDTITYIDTKNDITTRAEYNRRVKALENFMKKGAEDLHITKGNEGLSKWEWQQTLNQKRIVENRLNKRLAELDKPNKITGIQRMRMGSEEIAEIESTLESIRNINKVKGAAFKRIKSRIEMMGVKDYDMKRNMIYRENILEELRKIKDTNPDLKGLYEHFKNITNPNEFYEEIKKSEVMKDFFMWYKNPKDYGSFDSYEAIKDYAINEIQEFTEFEDYVLSLYDRE